MLNELNRLVASLEMKVAYIVLKQMETFMVHQFPLLIVRNKQKSKLIHLPLDRSNPKYVF
ncbi:hypothetical protein [Lysinibacillus sp. NPDC093692]|uniref:hypothetical protein n=1 Tax=Lysinibacillus sp. NPDC093692 TaxID=3390578 RepID=UPI003D02F069